MTIPQILKGLFARMRKNNPHFSMRAFARRLDTDPSSMSKIIKGQRIPSTETAEKWIQKLNLAPEEAAILRKALVKNREFEPLAAELFEEKYRWVHPILLEFLRLPDSKKRLPALCSFLEMTTAEITESLHYLETHNIIQRDSATSEYVPSTTSSLHIPYTTERRKQLQHKYLELAAQALDDVPFESREHSTLTFAIHAEDLPAVKETLQEARVKINAMSERRQDKVNAVYNFTSALYPLIEKP